MIEICSLNKYFHILEDYDALSKQLCLKVVIILFHLYRILNTEVIILFECIWQFDGLAI